MCNIAGYIGPRDAAAILCEMMARESGFAGGYYTGLATLDKGKLLHDKVLGDVDVLVSKAHADKIPGKIGIGHSRSKSGGDVRWGHPFVSNDGKMAYIANGSSGKLGQLVDRDSRALKIEEKGFVFDSVSDCNIGSYPHLSDGRCVHTSEVMCHLIRDHMISDKLSCAEAMVKSFLETPAEIVGLCLCADEPEAISFARYNMPCVVGRTDDEVFVASTAMAFPTDRNYISITEVPECSYGIITAKETVVHRFRSPIKVAAPDPFVFASVYRRIPEILREAGKPLGQSKLGKLCMDAWAGYEDCVICRHHVVYECIRRLIKDGVVELVAVDEPGADEGLADNIRTTQFYVKLK